MTIKHSDSKQLIRFWQSGDFAKTAEEDGEEETEEEEGEEEDEDEWEDEGDLNTE